MEGGYLNRYVTDGQRSRRPIFIATLWAEASWLFFRVARSTRMTQIWALLRQSGSDRLEKQPTDLRQSTSYLEYGTLGPRGVRPRSVWMGDALSDARRVISVLLILVARFGLRRWLFFRLFLLVLRRSFVTGRLFVLGWPFDLRFRLNVFAFALPNL
jgi:hypothetical protein